VKRVYAGSLDQPSTQPPLITPAVVNTDATDSRVSIEQGVPTLISHVFRRPLERGYRKRRESCRLTVVVPAWGSPKSCVLSAPCLRSTCARYHGSWVDVSEERKRKKE
jgi:hypothetical protein